MSVPSPWLLPHFLAFIDSLDLYLLKPIPLGPSRLIRARDGVCEFLNIPRPDVDKAPKKMNWLLDDRIDFSSSGWDSLLSSDSMVIH